VLTVPGLLPSVRNGPLNVKVSAYCHFRNARWDEFVPHPDAARTDGIKMLLAGLPNGEWHDLNLFRKVIGSWEIGVAVYEDSADDEY
jgi:hypothetical protein